MTGKEPRVLTGRLPVGKDPATGESAAEILRLPNGRVEFISSAKGVRSDQFVQDDDEWVVVLVGRGVVRVRDVEVSEYTLHAGDWLYLPAGTPHQVIDTDEGTRWLAFHLNNS